MRHLCAQCVFAVRHLVLLVYEMCGVLWVRCPGSVLFLGLLFAHRSLDVIKKKKKILCISPHVCSRRFHWKYIRSRIAYNYPYT